MSVNDAQQYHLNVVHVLRKNITFSDMGSTVSLGWVPAGAVVSNAYIVVDTAFNSGTTSTANMGFRNAGDGTTADADEFMTAVSVAAAGKAAADEIDASVADLYFPEGAELTVALAETGTAATAGNAFAVVEYTVDNS